MIKLLRLHLGYLLSRNNIIVLSLIILFYGCVCLFESKFYISNNEQFLYSNQYQVSYDHTIIMISKIILALISCYVFSNIKNNTYFMILGIGKNRFYLSKIMTNILVVIFITIVMFLIYLGVGLLTRWFVLEFKSIKLFCQFTLQSTVLGLISNNLCYLLKTNFAFILTFFLYIVFENIVNENIIIQIISIFFPILFNNNLSFLTQSLSLVLYGLTGFCLFKRYENY